MVCIQIALFSIELKDTRAGKDWLSRFYNSNSAYLSYEGLGISRKRTKLIQ